MFEFIGWSNLFCYTIVRSNVKTLKNSRLIRLLAVAAVFIAEFYE